MEFHGKSTERDGFAWNEKEDGLLTFYHQIYSVIRLAEAIRQGRKRRVRSLAYGTLCATSRSERVLSICDETVSVDLEDGKRLTGKGSATGGGGGGGGPDMSTQQF